MNLKIDREQWSRSSKQSYVYQQAAAHYGDIRYTCAKCQEDAVFTAEEQKTAFEQKKQYVWRRRVLCPRCNGELFKLRKHDRQCQARWAQKRGNLKSDRVFLEEWAAVLTKIPSYLPRLRSNMLVRLKSLLAQCAGESGTAA